MNINENPTTTTSIILVNDRILYRIFASAFTQNLIQASQDALFYCRKHFFHKHLSVNLFYIHSNYEREI